MSTLVIRGIRQAGAVLVSYTDTNGVRHFLLCQPKRSESLQFPGGYIEDTDPSIMDGVLRELLEETGLRIKPRITRLLKTERQAVDLDVSLFHSDLGILSSVQEQELKANIKIDRSELRSAQFVSEHEIHNHHFQGFNIRYSNMQILRQIAPGLGRQPSHPFAPAPKPAPAPAFVPTPAPKPAPTPFLRTQGHFEAIKLDFKRLDSQAQAKAILDRVQALHDQGHNAVGITYSANLDQREHLLAAHQKGQWHNIYGSNQADVMKHVGILLATPKYQGLLSVFKILPITTCDKHHNAVSDDIVRQDLAYIRSFAQQGGVVLGWQNQKSNPDKPFAIGGGVVKNQPKHQGGMIQGSLSQLQAQYPAPAAPISSPKVPPTLPVYPAKPSTTPQALFAKPAAKPASSPIGDASSRLALSIKRNDPNAIDPVSKVIFRKGNINGTFKAAFTSSHAAEQFLQQISHTHGFKNLTYYGSNEAYPMDGNGEVKAGGEYRYIVRFEIPTVAQQYLRKIHVPDGDELYNEIMGIVPALRAAATL